MFRTAPLEHCGRPLFPLCKFVCLFGWIELFGGHRRRSATRCRPRRRTRRRSFPPAARCLPAAAAMAGSARAATSGCLMLPRAALPCGLPSPAYASRWRCWRSCSSTRCSSSRSSRWTTPRSRRCSGRAAPTSRPCMTHSSRWAWLVDSPSQTARGTQHTASLDTRALPNAPDLPVRSTCASSPSSPSRSLSSCTASAQHTCASCSTWSTPRSSLAPWRSPSSPSTSVRARRAVGPCCAPYPYCAWSRWLGLGFGLGLRSRFG